MKFVLPENVKELIEERIHVGGQQRHHRQQIQQGAHQDHQVILLRPQNLEQFLHEDVLRHFVQPRRLLANEVAHEGQTRELGLFTGALQTLGDFVAQKLVVGVVDSDEDFQASRGIRTEEIIVEPLDEPRFSN